MQVPLFICRVTSCEHCTVSVRIALYSGRLPIAYTISPFGPSAGRVSLYFKACHFYMLVTVNSVLGYGHTLYTEMSLPA